MLLHLRLTIMIHATVPEVIEIMHLYVNIVIFLGMTILTNTKIFREDKKATKALVVNVGQFLVTQLAKEITIPVRIDWGIFWVFVRIWSLGQLH